MSEVERRIIAGGTAYETPLFIIRGERPGPVAAVVGGTHGDERAGYYAAWIVTRFTIERGTLLVIPQANWPAIQKRQRADHVIGDLNRTYPNPSSIQPRNDLARAIWEIYLSYHVKWSIDLHEGWDFHRMNPESKGQSLVYYSNPISRQIGQIVVHQLNQRLTEPKHRFSLLTNTTQGTLTRSTGTYLGVHSYTFETCRKQPLSVRINQQVHAVYFFLKSLNMRPVRPVKQSEAG
ncbi:MAG: succinylglutamate desuccinylase/aspartoacylase family protein [Solirubrobacterales bacterium]